MRTLLDPDHNLAATTVAPKVAPLLLQYRATLTFRPHFDAQFPEDFYVLPLPVDPRLITARRKEGRKEGRGVSEHEVD